MKTNDDSLTGYTKVISLEKNERVAHASLHDMMVFHDALDKEMLRLEKEAAGGEPVDADLVRKMTVSHEKFQMVIQGFMTLGDDQRHVLIEYGDAVQDLITHIHHKTDMSLKPLATKAIKSWSSATSMHKLQDPEVLKPAREVAANPNKIQLPFDFN